MKLRTLICADLTLVDHLTNRLSLINVIEEIATPTFPVAIYSVAVVSLWDLDESGDGRAELTVALNGQTLMKSELVIAFQGNSRTRNFLTIHGLVVTEPGELVFEVAFDDQTRAWRVPVRGIATAAQTPPASAPSPASST